MRRSDRKSDDTDAASIHLLVDGHDLRCWPGQSVAGALLSRGIYRLRYSPNARGPRGPFCMMGACQECAIRIDGTIRRACQTEVVDGMSVELRGTGVDRTDAGMGGKTAHSLIRPNRTGRA